MTSATATVCVICGDGIGREVIPATVQVLRDLDAGLAFVESQAGFDCFQESGDALPPATLETVRRSDAVLFGATASPMGELPGYRSPILRLRRELGLYANLRPCRSLPGTSAQPGIDLLIVRENSEGLYSGRERSEGETAIAERVISRAASERIARLACEQAMQRSAQRGTTPALTIVHKANVLQLTDGLFRQSARAVAREFAGLEVHEMLVDTAAMQLVREPQGFDVIVTTNLFGDILSDEAAGLIGGLGLAPSANLGAGTPVFEPVHGAAPDIAGQGVANPVAALQSAAMMLDHLGRGSHAVRLRSAIESVLVGGTATADLGGNATTAEFTQAVSRALIGKESRRPQARGLASLDQGRVVG